MKALPSNESVNEFCQILIDYLSAGHFEIYDDIVRQCQEHGPDSKALADNIYPQISQTTEVLVAFNDKYSDLHSDQSLKDFDSDLSEMGQVLEQRLELEDELIHTLYAKHS